MPTRQKLWDKKHGHIIEAATTVFLEYGYAATSMDAIAEKAQVSKITIYKHFKDKTELFNTMMAEHCRKLYTEVPLIEFSLKQSPATLIKEFSFRLIDALLQPRSMSLMRLVIAESVKFPEVATAVWEDGKMPLLEIFQDYLTKEEKAGRLQFPDRYLAAKQFFGMIKENVIWPVLIGMNKRPPSFQQTNKVVHHSVTMLLDYYKPSKKRNN